MKTLTIIIPTWNRARYLEKNLEILDSYLKRGLDFRILVCNNGSTDGTKDVLAKYRNHPKVRIIDHPENIKFDRNVASGYLNFDTDFCFCLGDTKTLSFESLMRIIKTINEEDIDAIVIKSANRLNKPEMYYNEINDLMDNLGWVLTNISSCVIPKWFITNDRCERYYDSQYIHYGVFIDALCHQNKMKVKYDPSIEKEIISFPQEVHPHGWTSNACSIFGKVWITFIMSLPKKVKVETKLKVIKDENKYYRFLTPISFIYAKINHDKAFFKDYKENKVYMPLVSSTPICVYDTITFVPSFFWGWLRPILKRIPRFAQKIN